MQPLESILSESARRHRHLCPRQILGARMALLAGEVLGLELPRADKRLLIIAETDGCTTVDQARPEPALSVILQSRV